MTNSLSHIQELVADISGMSLDPTSPSNNENALEYRKTKKTHQTIEYGKENKQLNELMTLSLGTI